MADILEVEGPTDQTLGDDRYIQLTRRGATWQEALDSAAVLVNRIREALIVESMPTMRPVIVWRARPYLISETDLNDYATTYAVKLALLTVPAINLAELSLDD